MINAQEQMTAKLIGVFVSLLANYGALNLYITLYCIANVKTEDYDKYAWSLYETKTNKPKEQDHKQIRWNQTDIL